MQVKRFLAADMRRALEMVRQELGPDAIILSSNRTKDGVEILTTPASAPLPEPEPTANAEEPPAPTEAGQRRVAAIEEARERQLAERRVRESADEFLQTNQRVNAGIPRRAPVASHSSPATGSEPAAQSASALRSAPEGHSAPAARSEHRPVVPDSAADRYGLGGVGEQRNAGSGELSELQAEMAEMRLLLEEQLTQMLGAQGTPGTPVMASVGRRLERLGLPKELATKLLQSCKPTTRVTQSWSEALASLSHQLPVDPSDRVSQGGVFALVGPTGAGKTTTIGKLAARYVMEHGPRDVALVTTDTHRIGAQDQLRSLGRILRIPVRVVDDQQSLDTVLYSLRRCALVLVDTAGFNHGDPRLAEQVENLTQQAKLEQLLVLSCNSQPQMLKASIHAYGGDSLKGCIFTKLDESASLGEALGVAMQTCLPIVYTTDGQDIPRDIDVARAHKLVAKAAALLKHTPADRAVRGGDEPTWRHAAGSN